MTDLSSGVRSAVVLLSGGLDSAANLALCAQATDRAPVLAITADYGQKAAHQEVRAARSLCEYYEIPHQGVDLRWLGELGGSALTESARTLPSLRSDQLDEPSVTLESAKAVWVPNRNGLLLQMAAAIAERMLAHEVLVGFNREEAETFPDNSQGFLEASNRALAYSTANQVQIYCYTLSMDKRQMVAALRELKKPFPFDRLWSCYGAQAQACGVCESCQRYARAVQGSAARGNSS